MGSQHFGHRRNLGPLLMASAVATRTWSAPVLLPLTNQLGKRMGRLKSPNDDPDHGRPSDMRVAGAVED
jgi:hypothetical protein